jgi:type I restriction enzyme, S subunit
VLARDSGVEGLGRIPQTWEVERLRWFIYSLEQGWSPQAEDREPQGDEWGVLKLNAVKGGEYDDSKVKALSTSLDVPSSLEVRPGDFLVTRANTPELVGDVCYVLATRPRRMISDLIYRLRLDGDRLDGRFLSYLLQSPVGRSQIEVAARGSSGSMVKISQDHLLDWLLLVPPIDEQRAIVSFIEREISRLDTLRSAAERTIMIAHERRAALIMEAINGRVPAAV